jgi:hypothetical protein
MLTKDADGNYAFDGSDGMEGVLKTGPVSGAIVLKDGTVYNVTDDFIEHKPGHAGPINHHIEKLLEKAGTLMPGFHHACSDACGAEKD